MFMLMFIAMIACMFKFMFICILICVCVFHVCVLCFNACVYVLYVYLRDCMFIFICILFMLKFMLIFMIMFMLIFMLIFMFIFMLIFMFFYAYIYNASSWEGQRENGLPNIRPYRTAGPFYPTSAQPCLFNNVLKRHAAFLCFHLGPVEPNIYPHIKNNICSWGSMLG